MASKPPVSVFILSHNEEQKIGVAPERVMGLRDRRHRLLQDLTMWRIDPESKLVVSVKSNPGEHTSAECGNRGYKNIKARKSRPVPTLRIGGTHRLRAEMRAEELNVFVDNTLVWEGSVGTEGGRFEGPVGIRSDNAKLQLELRAESRL